MPAPRPRRRAITLTAAVASAFGLALAGVSPAMAAHPAPTASPAGSSAFAAARAHLTPGSDAQSSARAAIAGVLAKRAAASGALKARGETPSSVVAAPATNVAPAKVNEAGNPDSGWTEVAVGDTLYGVGLGTEFDAVYLEKWTDVGWRRVPGVPSKNLLGAGSLGGSLYIATWASSRGTDSGTSTLWRLDGTAFTKVTSVPGFASLQSTASHLFVFSSTDDGDDIYSYDGTDLSRPAPAAKRLLSYGVLGDSLYGWVLGTKSSAIYSISAGSTTKAPIEKRAFTAPLSITATAVDGALYFGGVDLTAETLGVYRFDGTSAPVKTDVGLDFAKATFLPSVGSVDGDLYVTTGTAAKGDRLYEIDGTTATDVGAFATDDSLTFGFTGYDGKLFANVLGDDIETWVYDPAATKGGTPLVSSVPTIVGTAKVGTRLTAALGDWSPTATLSYQWLADGAEVSGATKTYHTVTGAEKGKALSLEVTGAGTAFAPSTPQLSASTSAASAGTIVLKPVISGTATPGKTLTAATPKLSPSGAKLTYRWYRDGAPLAGATKKTYKVTSGDAGHKLTVAVHATATGYTAAAAKSASKSVAKR